MAGLDDFGIDPYFGLGPPPINNSGGFGTMQQYGSGIPYRAEYGGFGTFPTQANAAYNAQNSGFNTAGLLGNIGAGAQAFGTLAQLYGIFKSLSLQDKAFKFNKEGVKRDFNANAQLANNAMAAQHEATVASNAARGRPYASFANYNQKPISLWT
jgi:hypothetical protein